MLKHCSWRLARSPLPAWGPLAGNWDRRTFYSSLQQAGGPSPMAAAAASGASGGAPLAAGAPAQAAQDSQPQGRSRAYPDEPRVGVGVVCFRRAAAAADAEV